MWRIKGKMNDTFKKAALATLFTLLLSGACLASTITIYTGTMVAPATQEGITDQSGSTVLPRYCLVQIIKVNSTIHPPDRYGNPTGGDILTGICSIGDGFPFDDNGCFQTLVSASQGDQLICRAWNAITIEAATFYGNSEIFPVGSDPFQTWDINGTADIPAFSTSLPFDLIPPSPPTNVIATQEVSGDIFLSWTASSSLDAAGTRIVFKLGSYPTNETDGTILANVPQSGPQSYRHTGLTNGTLYYYGLFAYDNAGNFSVAATTSETSSDTLPPSILSVSPANGATGVPDSVTITVNFNDNMNTAAAQNAFLISPSVPKSFSWIASNTVMQVGVTLSGATTYVCTVTASASDDAGNLMGSDYTWSFSTVTGPPPVISDFMLDGWKRFPGDVISSRPKISAIATDPLLGAAGISSIEVMAGAISHLFSPSEMASIFDPSSGAVNFTLPGTLPEGTFDVSLKVWNTSRNSSEETISGVQVLGGPVKVVGQIVNYPNPFDSSGGTTFAYTLSSDANLDILVYSIKGSVVYKKSVTSGSPGGTAGYNEVFWNGESNFGEGVGSGLYLVRLVSGGRIIGSFKLLVQNR